MILPSSQQIRERGNPTEEINNREFEMIVMMFASYICMVKNKKFNYLTFLRYIVEDREARKLFCKFIGDDSFQSVVRTYLNTTPNICKKIFRSKFSLTVK